ncbi:hypothetical protein CDL15_Pgr016563 [Punica granatum]|uniref:Uncharacterized protein n=1 Tax=Punica granatum TaxID=22663 RepID=A0A218WL17_PUNGR|nr:hypothetical protein CDL15_Pgr016563 [Punica granatum]PKI77724.1 hypothetical protein CRG98_001848 [Punica granatum]
MKQHWKKHKGNIAAPKAKDPGQDLNVETIEARAAPGKNEVAKARGDDTALRRSLILGIWTRMWTLVGARIARFWIARLGRNVHLPVGTRDGRA